VYVGALHIELRIRGMRSLKEKRRVMKRITAEIGSAHPVGVAEVDHQNLWQRADVGIAAVSGTRGQVDRMLASIVREIDRYQEVEVLRSGRTYLPEVEQ
jgi:uncharacterized protein YlxP (DUF503 family)